MQRARLALLPVRGPDLVDLWNISDRALHERIREDLRAGRIGLAQNRLPADTTIADVEPGDVASAAALGAEARARGEAALRAGQVAIVTLAAGG
jgi:hypothetical protein